MNEVLAFYGTVSLLLGVLWFLLALFVGRPRSGNGLSGAVSESLTFGLGVLVSCVLVFIGLPLCLLGFLGSA